MESVNQTISCTNCGTILPSEWASTGGEQACPNCNSTNQTILLEINETEGIEIHENIRGKLKDPSLPSKDKLRKDIFAGDDLRKSDGKWMKKERIIDRDSDYYKEVVTDPSTGEVIHSTEEPLSEHFGHGSAKKKLDAI